jgi:hypothetical protein
MKKTEFIKQYFAERFGEEPTYIDKTTATENDWEIYNVMSKNTRAEVGIKPYFGTYQCCTMYFITIKNNVTTTKC